MIAALSLAYLLHVPTAETLIELRDMRVTGVSARPVDSGVLATFVKVLARGEDGAVVTLHIPAMSQSQPLPPVSGLCRFEAAERVLPRRPAGAELGLVVTRFACTIGSDSPPLPAASPLAPL